MFHHLSHFRRIFVTGPHRSGTRIATRMIARDTGHFYVDETMIWESPIGIKAYSQWYPAGVVFHGPLLMHILPKIATAEDCVILMRRPVEECERSARRIGITPGAEQAERVCWYRELGFAQPDINAATMAAFKYEAWRRFVQRDITAKLIEVDYHSLKSHTLWRDDRDGFRWDQTGPKDFRSRQP